MDLNSISYLRFNLHGLLGVISGILGLVVGIVILTQNPRSRVNLSFFLVTASTFFWTCGFGMASLVRNPDDAYGWIGFAFVAGVPFISVLFYIFGAAWIGRRSFSTAGARVGLAGAFLIGSTMVALNRQLIGFEDYAWGRYPYYLTTPLARTYSSALLALFAIYGTMAYLNLRRGYRQASSPKDRLNFRTLMIGFVIAYTGAADFLTVFRIPVYPFGYLSLFSLAAYIGYAIARHQVFDVNLLLRRAAAVTLVYCALLAAVVPMGILLLRRWISAASPDLVLPALAVAILLGVVFSLGPIIYAFLVRHSFWLRRDSSAGLAHELKSPVGSIRAAADMLQTYVDAGTLEPARVQEYVSMIQRNSDRLDHFVKNLLDLARIQEGGVSLEKKSLDMVAVARSVIEVHDGLARQKGLSIRLNGAASALIVGDEEKIRQALSNLLSNALKYSESGPVEVTVEPRAGGVSCAVRDSGRGVPRQQLHRIFERFYQIDRSAKGAGLGLAIAKGWVEAHGGRIWAESEGEGKGTTVTFMVPVEG